MGYDFAVIGNGWEKNIYYTAKEEYISFDMSGGGCLVAQILGQQGFSVAPAEIRPPAQVEHLSLACSGDGLFSIGSHMGFSKGNNVIEPQDADILIVYDEGISESPVPDGCSIL